MSLADRSPAEGHTSRPHGPEAFRRILVAVDDSETAGTAASFAIRLAGTARADVMLVHACPELRWAEHAPPHADPAVLQAAADHRLAETSEWQRRLQHLAEYGAAGARVHWRVLRGRAAPAILEAATELDSDVVFVGSRGRGAVRAPLLGSVSSQVLQHARCSVMTFPARADSSPAHVAAVVAGADGSPCSAAAVAAGSELAAALDAKLVLLTAFRSASALGPQAPEVREEIRRDAAAVLTSARAAVTADVDIVEELHDGSPREALLAAAEHHGPAVLAVGTRGLGGFEGLLLGSTSRWLAHHASCPVLVARERP